MKLLFGFVAMAASVAIAGLVVSCSSTGEAMSGSMPFGTPQEIDRAAALWSEIRGYRSWPSYPGLAGWEDGKSPHGRYLKYYLNPVAARNPSHPTAGYVIVKENYMAKSEGALGAVTVMKKIPGYDRDNADWFWVKFDRNGGVMKNPKGMALAGRVAKGMSRGCLSCHSQAGGKDFLYSNDLE